MIKANELRIGNYLQDDTGRIGKVLEFKEGYIVLKMLHSTVKIKSNVGTSDIDADGIPLTPEIIEKCGFKIKKGSGANIFEWHIGTNPVNQDWLFCITEFRYENVFFYRNGYFKINTIHQLQNLYFALTGDELNINL